MAKSTDEVEKRLRRRIEEDIRRDFLALTSGSEDSHKAWILRALFGGLSGIYREVVLLRNRLYASGAIRQTRLPLPSVSVGNVTVGGTGKTPFVEYTVKKLLEVGRRPAVVARGYGPRLKGSNGRKGANDESLLLSANTNAPVILTPNRLAGTYRAAEMGADTVVLDDAFQHLKVHRDLDVVLLDATAPFGFGKMLPRGLLREPMRALDRADMVVITRVDLARPADVTLLRNAAIKAAPGKPVALTAHHSDALVDVASGEKISVREMEDRPIGAFCGIGNPYSFGLLLRRLGSVLVVARRFGDHHLYAPQEIVEVAGEARREGAGFLVTTQKDAVKIDKGLAASLPLPIYYLQMSIDMIEGEDTYMALLLEAIDGFRARTEEEA
ncbi:MAG: tetraacyldisaccharide 4'-kinase [Planctomycetes bacterium]|nr:tetraacyldisaccharide 4'-kinase [Planctomycetota bacterium]